MSMFFDRVSEHFFLTLPFHSVQSITNGFGEGDEPTFAHGLLWLLGHSAPATAVLCFGSFPSLVPVQHGFNELWHPVTVTRLTCAVPQTLVKSVSIRTSFWFCSVALPCPLVASLGEPHPMFRVSCKEMGHFPMEPWLYKKDVAWTTGPRRGSG